MQKETFVIERIYSTSIENVWRALTNGSEMKQWHFNIPGFIPEPGYEFQFSSSPDEERQYTHYCQVTEFKLLNKLAFTWQYNQYEDVTLVTFELFEQPDGRTKLRLTHEGLEAFPESDPDFTKESFIKGWTWIVENALKAHVEKMQKTPRYTVKAEV